MEDLEIHTAAESPRQTLKAPGGVLVHGWDEVGAPGSQKGVLGFGQDERSHRDFAGMVRLEVPSVFEHTNC